VWNGVTGGVASLAAVSVAGAAAAILLQGGPDADEAARAVPRSQAGHGVHPHHLRRTCTRQLVMPCKRRFCHHQRRR
jgi:hypothetical protein